MSNNKSMSISLEIPTVPTPEEIAGNALRHIPRAKDGGNPFFSNTAQTFIDGTGAEVMREGLTAIAASLRGGNIASWHIGRMLISYLWYLAGASYSRTKALRGLSAEQHKAFRSGFYLPLQKVAAEIARDIGAAEGTVKTYLSLWHGVLFPDIDKGRKVLRENEILPAAGWQRNQQTGSIEVADNPGSIQALSKLVRDTTDAKGGKPKPREVATTCLRNYANAGNLEEVWDVVAEALGLDMEDEAVSAAFEALAVLFVAQPEAKAEAEALRPSLRPKP